MVMRGLTVCPAVCQRVLSSNGNIPLRTRHSSAGRGDLMADSLVARSLGLFAYLLLLDCAAIFFFTRGFLLTRTELSLISNCSDVGQKASTVYQPSHTVEDIHDTADIPNSGDVGETPSLDYGKAKESVARHDSDDQKCWTKPAIKKAIILIIDALRFDFAANSRNFGGDRKPWMDKLGSLNRVLEENYFPGRLFKFIADPPTTTLQRLKGLTTGGLPTFMDIGHSFGAPAIVEDNLILQLMRTGKEVIMMGDDTWTQLFPTQFAEAYPFPSFNVKDLHTVDDGVIRELFPALQRDNWNVLIAHFLGVDHVGHIFGVESPLMVDKLEQYNIVIEDLIGILGNMSGPGESFEDSILIVMGDHGQTLHGDHGGGTSEEVETALFVMGTNHNSNPHFHSKAPSPCDLEDPVIGCVNSFSQLDFAATLAAVLGVPFPFGSVGHVNADFFSLVVDSVVGSSQRSQTEDMKLKFLETYRDTLCINSWQVKRYFDAYAQAAMTSFQAQNLAELEELYEKAQGLSSQKKEFDHGPRVANGFEATTTTTAAVKEQIDAHKEYLSTASSLARSQWTQFGLGWMVVGFVLLVACIAVRVAAIWRLHGSNSASSEILFPSKSMLICILPSLYVIGIVVVLNPLLSKTVVPAIFVYVNDNLGVVSLETGILASVVGYFAAFSTVGGQKRAHKSARALTLDKDKTWDIGEHLPLVDAKAVGSFSFVVLHAISLFSNSFIVQEGQVIHFLIITSSLLYLRLTIQAKTRRLQAVLFVVLNFALPRVHMLRVFKGGMSGEGPAVTDGFLPSSLLRIMQTCVTIIIPLGILWWFLLNQERHKTSLLRSLKILGVTQAYSSISLYWLMGDLADSDTFTISVDMVNFARLYLPRIVYATTILLTLTAPLLGRFCPNCDNSSDNQENEMAMVGTVLLAGASGTIIMLLGRKGPLLAILAALEVWVFLKLQSVTKPTQIQDIVNEDMTHNEKEEMNVSSFGSTADWSLMAGHLFFCTGHSCAFDGLHYSAAFIGFDNFGFYQQGLLLATETFGASHFLPVVTLPLLVAFASSASEPVQRRSENRSVVRAITRSYLWYGLLHALVAVVTTASVFIQRRHLMVWGIFAPKYVFDAIGCLLVDVFVLLAQLYLPYLQSP